LSIAFVAFDFFQLLIFAQNSAGKIYQSLATSLLYSLLLLPVALILYKTTCLKQTPVYSGQNTTPMGYRWPL